MLFRVQIGQFTINVRMLNISANGYYQHQTILYRGGKVTVVELKSTQLGTFVSKRTQLEETVRVLKFISDGIEWSIVGSTEEIQEVVLECAFGKLCAALGIGVQMGSPDNAFDIICW